MEHTPGSKSLYLYTIAMACKDAWEGDVEAARFVAEHAEALDTLGITDAETVRSWAENPQPPQGLRTKDMAQRLGWNRSSVFQAIQMDPSNCLLGNIPLPAALVPFGHQHYLINKNDAAWYERIIGGGGFDE
jgi:hypothetical protein